METDREWEKEEDQDRKQRDTWNLIAWRLFCINTRQTHTNLSFRMNSAPSWTKTVDANTARTSSLSNLQRRWEEVRSSTNGNASSHLKSRLGWGSLRCLQSTQELTPPSCCQFNDSRVPPRDINPIYHHTIGSLDDQQVFVCQDTTDTDNKKIQKWLNFCLHSSSEPADTDFLSWFPSPFLHHVALKLVSKLLTGVVTRLFAPWSFWNHYDVSFRSPDVHVLDLYHQLLSVWTDFKSQSPVLCPICTGPVLIWFCHNCEHRLWC